VRWNRKSAFRIRRMVAKKAWGEDTPGPEAAVEIAIA
jgi:hypothetical protein